MIHEITMFAASCDSCGITWESCQGYSAMHDAADVRESMLDQLWVVGRYTESDEHEDKVYCPECATINDDDKIVFKNPNEDISVQVSDTTMSN